MRNWKGWKAFFPIRGDFTLVLDIVQKPSCKTKHFSSLTVANTILISFVYFVYFTVWAGDTLCWGNISTVQCLALSRRRLQTQIVEKMCGFICRWFASRLLLGESCWCLINLLLVEKYFFLKSTGKTCPEQIWWGLYLSISIIQRFADAVCMWSCLLFPLPPPILENK